MHTKSFALVGDGDGWAFTGPGELSRTYQTRELAFQAAVAAIAAAMAEGDEIELKIPRVAVTSVDHGLTADREVGAELKPNQNNRRAQSST